AARVGELDLADVGLSLASIGAGFERRAVVIGSEGAELLAGRGAGTGGQVVAGKTGVVFAGQGAQWAGMGRGVDEGFPVLREGCDGVCAGRGEGLGCCVRG
ncbi:hypothetical protein VM98_39220, partial [Streptomyces rubellomurinus subsp. indigoferus]